MPDGNKYFFFYDLKMNKEKILKLKTEKIASHLLLQLNSPYTQGIGFFYREDFDTIGELWRKYFDKK